MPRKLPKMRIRLDTEKDVSEKKEKEKDIDDSIFDTKIN